MNSIRKTTLALVLAATLAVTASSSARAGGLVGDFLNSVTGTDIGTQLDDLNGDLGNPFDHGVAIVCDAYLPGCGEALEDYYAYNRGGVSGLIDHATQDDDDSDE
jgi:hypothetical protein